MQRTLHFTRQLGIRASFSASSSASSLLNSQSTRYLTPLTPRRVRGLTASSPLLIDDDTEYEYAQSLVVDKSLTSLKRN